MISNLIDTLMEKTVVPSFSSMGPGIRRRLFNWRTLESYALKGQVIVLTGGTSGIGEAAAQLYASLGATLCIVARNPDKTQLTVERLKIETGNAHIHSVIGDLGVQDDVRRIASELAAQFPVIDVLAHNAGALFNERMRADNGTDLTVELMVSAPFLLTALLLPQLNGAARSNDDERRDATSVGRTQPGRVLTMSSGGMYTEALTVDGLAMPDADYQGAQQYARAKRAQVVLNELWAEKIPTSNTVFHALHPGWVATPGITEALPGFSKVLGPVGLLRSPREGADTLVWLSADTAAKNSSGKFWHDRAPRSTHMSVKTRKAETQDVRQQLWQWCETHTQISVS